MYAQITTIQVPTGMMAALRELVETSYLPVVRARPGFLAGYLLEQVDDAESAQIILFWESHAAVENFARTGTLQASLHALAADIPGVQVKRQGYMVPVAVRSAPEALIQ